MALFHDVLKGKYLCFDHRKSLDLIIGALAQITGSNRKNHDNKNNKIKQKICKRKCDPS